MSRGTAWSAHRQQNSGPQALQEGLARMLWESCLRAAREEVQWGRAWTWELNWQELRLPGWQSNLVKGGDEIRSQRGQIGAESYSLPRHAKSAAAAWAEAAPARAGNVS